MATKVVMPQLGESVVEGTVTSWLKREGDTVEEFEALVEVNTDKVDTEIPSPAAGTLLAIYVPEGQTVEAGRLLAVIGEPGEEVEPPGPEAAPAPAAAPEVKAPTPPSSPAPPPTRALGFISRVVARMAAEHNLDLTAIPGTGRGGRITKKDVLAYLESRGEAAEVRTAPWEQPGTGELFRPTEEIFQPPAREGVEAEADFLPHTPVRRAIAEHMLRSKQTSPHVTTVMEADLSRVVAHRRAQKAVFERDGVKLTFTPYFIACAVRGLKAVPLANASWEEQGIRLHREVNIGVAVSLGERGLIVPVIRGADGLSLLALARAVNDLAARARTGELTPDEVQGGTFTLTNHGVAGSLFATPIISQPQAAILGVGAIQKRVVVVEGDLPGGGMEDTLAIRPMVYLSLTFDHRIMDGAVADQFLGEIVRALETWG